MRCKHLVIALALALGAGGACRKGETAADPTTVIARYKGGEIRRGEIADALARRFAAAQQPLAPETKKAIVRQVVERRVRTAMLLEEAKGKGFDRKSEVQARQTVAEERALAKDLLDRATAGAKAAESLVAAEVDRRLAEAPPEETRKFSHIYLRAADSDPSARQAATARMDKILADLKGGAGFNKLAEQWSTSVTARGGGKIDFTPRRALNKAAAAAIFALKEGEVSTVVATPDGLHLFRLDGIRPGTPIDVDAVRKNVRAALDDEARRAAERARRQQELDAQGVELAAPEEIARLAEDPAAARDQVVAHWQGGEVRAGELLDVEGWVTLTREPLAAELKMLVENRLLAAARRREAISPELSRTLAEVRDKAVIDSYRGALIAQLDTRASDEEIERFYKDRSESVLALRDFEVDAMFFPQSGESVKDVYAAGEEVGTKLRDGLAFDDLLRAPVRAEARLCRAAHGVDLDALGKTSIRLRKALLNLVPGDVTPAIYLDGPTTVLVPQSCVLDGRGVVFLRLRSLAPRPLDTVRDTIRAALAKEKEDAGIEAIQGRLIAASGLQILVPEG